MSDRLKKDKSIILYVLYFILSLAILLFWLSFIYGMSAKTGEESSGLSYEITEYVYSLPVAPHKSSFDRVHLFIRKTAHFTEYGFLSLFIVNFLNSCRVIWNGRKLIKKSFRNGKNTGYMIAVSMLFCGIYASLDEYHQSFVDGREPCVRDVGIDIAGACTFMFFLWLCYWLWGKRKGCRKQMSEPAKRIN